jgi:spore germination cell wall hydrolase CwlJ-like protein
MMALGIAALERAQAALAGVTVMTAKGIAVLSGMRLSLVGAFAVFAVAAAPATMTDTYTDESLDSAKVRLGFLAALPEPEEVDVSGARAGEGVVRRRKAAQAITKVSRSEQRCLAEALYYEARGEGHDGQMAVAEVVIRRSKTRGYPSTICGVVYQGNPGGTTGCQFSFVCNGSMNRRREPGAWSRAQRLASRIGTGKVALTGATGNALFFHATSVRPHWPGLVRTAQIGSHVFYARSPKWRGTGAAGRRLRYRGSTPRFEEAVERTPKGGILLPDGSIEAIVPAAAPAAGLDLTVRPALPDTGA